MIKIILIISSIPVAAVCTLVYLLTGSDKIDKQSRIYRSKYDYLNNDKN